MTTTTKIFVILVSLFAFIFTPMAIQFAARTENWKELADQYREQRDTALAQQAGAQAILAAETQNYKDQLGQQEQRLLQSRQTIDQLEQQIDELTQERDQALRSRDNWETSARLLTGEMKIKTEHNQELAAAKETCLERERELQSRNIDLNDRVKELSSNLVVLRQQLRQVQEELAACRSENEELRDKLNLGRAGQAMTSEPTPSARAETPVAVSPIQGTITEVRGTLATVDVGSASGLKEGMVLVVTRDGQYVGDMEVTSDMTPNEAIARIIRETKLQIRQGDQIVDETSFETRQ